MRGAAAAGEIIIGLLAFKLLRDARGIGRLPA
jgi:hypothetical protein